jgi:hypothetical protein
MRRASRVDSNSDEITACLLNLGADVRDTHLVGRGFPDKVVGWCGRTILIEILQPDAKPYEVREHQDRRALWKGDSWLIVQSVADVLAQLGVEVQA